MAEPIAASPPAFGGIAPPRARHGAAWFTVAVMCLAQLVSTIDRGMLALVIDPVRADLGITDLQIALLQGFAFSVFYVTVGLPLGAIADAVDRRWLLVAGIVAWSAATIGGGLARDFAGMFASRLVIGIGEAVLAPCAVTMIGDLFPAAVRGRPMAVYVFGTMIAFGIGSLVSGLILQLVPQGAFAGIAPLARLAPWRIAFVLVGGFGFVVAALLALLREPPRRVVPGDAAGGVGWRANLAYLRRHRAVFVPLYAALALFAAGGSVATGWGAVLLTRSFGFSLGAAGKGLGAGQIAWATIGAALAGVLVDRVARAGGPAAKVRLAAVVALAAIPSSLAALAPGGSGAVAMLGEIMFASALYGTTMLSLIAEIAPLRLRGLMVALYAFVMAMIGGSLGPIAVAWLTQHVLASPARVGWSMAMVGPVCLVASAACALAAARRLEARAWLR